MCLFNIYIFREMDSLNQLVKKQTKQPNNMSIDLNLPKIYLHSKKFAGIFIMLLWDSLLLIDSDSYICIL